MTRVHLSLALALGVLELSCLATSPRTIVGPAEPFLYGDWAEGPDAGVDLPDGVLSVHTAPDGGSAVVFADGGTVHCNAGLRRPVVLPPRRDVPYPAEWRDMHREGLVIMRCNVTLDGNVWGCRVLFSKHPFDAQPQIDVVQSWRMQPGELCGVPVALDYVLSLNFRMP